MDIVIIANFCLDFSETDNGRFSYLANILSENHNVEIITSSFYHINKKQREAVTKHPYKISLIDEPGYEKNISLKRFYSHYIWGKNVGRYLARRKTPDVVYCAIPSLTGPMLVAKYCEKKGIKFIIDIQDLWPEAFQMIFNIPIISNLIYFPFKYMANSIYKRANQIVAVSQTYVDCALKVNKKCNRGYSIFLGTELKIFDENAKKISFLNKNKDEIWLAYCGTLGSSYDLTNVMKAIYQAKISNLYFIIMGNGPLMETFQLLAKKLEINVVFTGRLAYDDMCSILCKCDMTVNPIMPGAAQSIINKHADYLASGLPIINTQENEEIRELIEKYQCGINCKNANEDDIKNAIIKLCNDDELRNEMGKNARKLAVDKFDRAKTYKKIINLIIE